METNCKNKNHPIRCGGPSYEPILELLCPLSALQQDSQTRSSWKGSARLCWAGALSQGEPQSDTR